MDRDNDHEMRENIVALIRDMDADTLRQFHAFISGLEAKGTERKVERDESG